MDSRPALAFPSLRSPSTFSTMRYSSALLGSVLALALHVSARASYSLQKRTTTDICANVDAQLSVVFLETKVNVGLIGKLSWITTFQTLANAMFIRFMLLSCRYSDHDHVQWYLRNGCRLNEHCRSHERFNRHGKDMTSRMGLARLTSQYQFHY